MLSYVLQYVLQVLVIAACSKVFLVLGKEVLDVFINGQSQLQVGLKVLTENNV